MSNLAVSSSSTLKAPTTTPVFPLTELPQEILKNVFFFEDRFEKFPDGSLSHLAHGLVCKAWRILTLEAWIDSQRYLLQEFIGVLNQQASLVDSVKELTEISTSFTNSHNKSLTTPEQIDRSFWSGVGKVLSVLKKLKPEDRTKIEQTIGTQIPSSLNQVFVLAGLTMVQAVQQGNFETISIVHTSCLPLPHLEQNKALSEAAKRGHFLAIGLLATDESMAEMAVEEAWAHNQRRCVERLLTSGKVSRYSLVWGAMRRDNNTPDYELLRFVHDKGSLTDAHQSVVLDKCIINDKPECIPLIFIRSPISSVYFLINAFQKAIDANKPEFIPLILTYVPLSLTQELFQKAVEQEKLEVARAILDARPISDPDQTALAQVALTEKMKGYQDLLKFKSLPNEIQMLWLLWTITENRQEIRKSMLNLVSISDDQRTELAICAINHGNYNTLKFVLDQGPVHLYFFADLRMRVYEISDPDQRMMLIDLLYKHNFWRMVVLDILAISCMVILALGTVFLAIVRGKALVRSLIGRVHLVRT